MTKKLITYHQQKMKVESNENELTEREKGNSL